MNYKVDITKSNRAIAHRWHKITTCIQHASCNAMQATRSPRAAVTLMPIPLLLAPSRDQPPSQAPMLLNSNNSNDLNHDESSP